MLHFSDSIRMMLPTLMDLKLNTALWKDSQHVEEPIRITVASWILPHPPIPPRLWQIVST